MTIFDMILRSLYVMLIDCYIHTTSVNEAVVLSYKELPQNTVDLFTFQMMVLMFLPGIIVPLSLVVLRITFRSIRSFSLKSTVPCFLPSLFPAWKSLNASLYKRFCFPVLMGCLLKLMKKIRDNARKY